MNNPILKLKEKAISALHIFKKWDRSFIMVMCFVLLTAVNMLINPFSLRLDLSNGKAYTLSESTKKILRNLDDLVHISFYASSDIPARLLPLKTEIIDLMNEYKKESKGKIILKILDPKKDEKALQKVKELGIPELQFSQLEKDKYQVTSSYLGIGITYGDKKEMLPQATDLGNLEYNITSLVYKLTNKETHQIGFIQPIVDPQSDPTKLLKNILSQQYDVIPLDLSDDSIKDIDSAVKAAILIDVNTKQYSETELDKIKKYVNAGGNIIFFIDGVWVNDNLTTAPAEHNLYTLLDGWDITLQKNLVLSTSAEFVNFGNDLYQLLTPYPFWIKTNNVNQKTEYFANVRQITFPWTSSLMMKKKIGNAEILVSSPQKSWIQNESFELMPQNISVPPEKDMKSYPLIIKTVINKKGSVVVIPSSRFANTQYLSQTSGNIDFIYNLINNLASGGALSNIRSRTISFYPLPEMSDTQKELLKYTTMLLLPALFGIYGTWRLLKRK